MKISSPVFEKNQIPAKYTCDGDNFNPPLQFSEIPANAKSLALICDDPDAPSGSFVHWVLWNINPRETQITERSIPQGSNQGKNSAGSSGYLGPCPPSGTHRYFFKLYALDTELELKLGTNKNQLEQAMQDHILEQAGLIGLYSRKS